MKLTAFAMCVVIIGISINGYAAETQPGVSNMPAGNHRNYIPHTGEIMGFTQMRHSKLWFAGNARNWDLADYELDEIKEGLEDLVKYYPVFENNVQIATMLGKFVDQPINDIHEAIESKNSVKFKKSFDSLTKACNGCHQAARRGFIKIKRPGIAPYSNQEFAIK